VLLHCRVGERCVQVMVAEPVRSHWKRCFQVLSGKGELALGN
jgi:hypothetical protein